jgi:hypothetical protein
MLLPAPGPGKALAHVKPMKYKARGAGLPSWLPDRIASTAYQGPRHSTPARLLLQGAAGTLRPCLRRSRGSPLPLDRQDPDLPVVPPPITPGIPRPCAGRLRGTANTRGLPKHKRKKRMVARE